jgi:type I restriction enzyme S subunit
MDPNGTHPVYGGNGISGYHSSYMFETPVIVIGRVGFYCGAVYYTEPKSWVTDNALYVADKTEDLKDAYLVSALRLANLNQYSGQAAQPLISGSRIYPVEILVPPLSLQEEYVRQVMEVHALEMEQTVSRQRLEDMFQSLLHRAFQGEL